MVSYLKQIDSSVGLEYADCILCRGVRPNPHPPKKRDILGKTLNSI